MIMTYWERVGGTLILEFPVVKQTRETGPRRLDAVILPNGPKTKASWRDVSLKGEDVIVVQAKANRLGMYLMGQTLFSAELIKQFEPASIRSIALCAKDDSIMRPMLERFPAMEVVVMDDGSRGNARI